MRNLSSSLFFLFFISILNLSFAQQGVGTIKGTLVDQNGVPAMYARVVIEETEIGTITDEEGKFKISSIPPGSYTLVITSLEHQKKRIEEVDVKADQITFLDKEVLIIYQQIQTLKPILYFYPEDTMEISVSLNYDGQLTTTYPKYEDGWSLTATPESTLTDASGRTYYSLYWEGIPNTPLTIKEGSVVSKEETISFLEENLSILGLSEREANEFIIFWLPILEKNPFNLISFSTEEYENQAQLSIAPKPDKVIRVMMVYRGLESPIDIDPQHIEELRQERVGFTVVEWGGQESITFDVN